MPISFRAEVVGIYRSDVIVNDVVSIELKALVGLLRQHESQTMHHLKATDIEVALLMNFERVPSFKRLIMDNERRQIREKSVVSPAICTKALVSAEVIA